MKIQESSILNYSSFLQQSLISFLGFISCRISIYFWLSNHFDSTFYSFAVCIIPYVDIFWSNRWFYVCLFFSFLGVFLLHIQRQQWHQHNKYRGLSCLGYLYKCGLEKCLIVRKVEGTCKLREDCVSAGFSLALWYMTKCSMFFEI